ncbi:MAG: nicotinate (nicotinamide) nucleotide adenylyltransferase [bacterium]|nr:nicotinate (nicotinamide) nucleotide adenylyltransferase [bacterium]
MKIGLFGGTFNPIHNGHLIISQAVLDQFELDKIIFLTAGEPSHKNVDLLPKENRYNMVAIAISNNPKFFISPLEMLGDYRYSYQTIEHFLVKYQEDEIFFIMGMDSLNNLDSWKKGLKLLDMCRFIVVRRPNETPRIDHENIVFFNDVNIDISSTIIRNKIKNKESIKYLVPDGVDIYYRNLLR